jgi:hypothetical protein
MAAFTIALGAWLAASWAQQGTTPPAAPPPAEAPPAAPPAEEEEGESADEPEDVFIPTEELQPDAAVTFPVDI